MLADLCVIRQLLRGTPRGADHKERLERFYRPQAGGYDRFRERLLRGRRELIDSLPASIGATVVELGGGTGRSLEFFGERLATFSSLVLVDLCPPLLERARERCRLHGWTNVHCIEADATRFGPAAPVDCVYLSYALTMIPDWFAAIDNALAMLKPGGTLGVVDFYVSRAHPVSGLRRHGLATRHFWPLWFGHDGVHLNPDHLPYLLAHTVDHQVVEERSPVPWMGGLTVPCYRFIGRKPDYPSGRQGRPGQSACSRRASIQRDGAVVPSVSSTQVTPA